MRIFNCYNPVDYNYGSFCYECIKKYGVGTEVILTEITDQTHDVNFWNAHLESCELCSKLVRVKTFTVSNAA